jgi:predicted RNA-binding protein with PIN domain
LPGVPYLIDGNNLLGSWRKARPPGEDGRSEVLRRVAAFCRARGASAVLVFDGSPWRAGLARQSLGPLTVVFPPEGADADEVIRRTLDRAERPADWTVVTSDKAVYSYARSRGAAVLRAHEWNALERSKRPLLVPGAEKPDREDDVEGWLRTFGVEE